MAFVLADRVQETTTTTGTGTLTLAGAVVGYDTFSASIGANNTTYYAISTPGGSDWEVGLGTVGAGGTTLDRTTVYDSSNAGSLVNLAAGTKNVFVTYPAGKSVRLDTSGNVSALGTVASGTWNGGTVGVAYGGTGATTLTGIVKGSGTSAFTAATANTDYLVPALANTAVTGFKTATFNSQTTIATTSGSITVDWTTAQNQKQTEPTGTITYTFTAPPGPCHLQLIIDSDGTSTAQTINWPGTVVWLGATWAGTNNKKAVINFWYDGSSYFAIGTNQG